MKKKWNVSSLIHFSFRASYFVLCTLCLVLFYAGCATVPRSAPVTSMPTAPEGIIHVVGGGETLWRIAKDYGVELSQIMQSNRLPDGSHISAGQRLVIPQPEITLPMEPVYPPVPINTMIQMRVGPRHPDSDWRTITMHHSATREGNAKSFDRNHRRRRMGGLFYHFVIGNGTGSRDGEVEVGWRWRKQAEVNRPYDIQICLVGDFNKQRVSEAQFDSLVNLIRILERQYNISTSHVRRHKDIRGKTTECPGNHFPFQKLLAELKRTSR